MLLRRTMAASAAVLLIAVALTPAALAQGAAAGKIDLYEVDGIISPSTASYLTRGIEESNRDGARLIVIRLDTPGGLDPSMRDIVKAILNSSRPVAVWVSPRGARAASAGVFITMAAHVAAMAPGTNIGAAHPVTFGGEATGEMKKKMENDAAAYIKSIAEARGRNVEWAEKAVRESVSIPESEALSLKVIDLVAEDLDTLLREVNGRRVTTAGGEVTVDTSSASVNRKGMGLRWSILQAISNPNIAYVLMMVGILGLFFELSHPGAVLPGVVGAMSLILGFYGLQTLPINYAGLLLILLGILLFIAEIKITSYGFLTIGGVISLLLGSLMLVNTSAPFLRISLPVILGTVTAMVLVFLFLATAVLRTYRRRRPTTGMEGLLGSAGEALTDLRPRGKIFVHGEIWDARCGRGAAKGDKVRVTGAEGLTLEVEPLDKEV